ncbi:MAG: T9SS type A sorting domain-containing protein [Bacteroidetes bacterium]|nr:T9SS type A sorting domain-containing protein [Bacteroidota bacterium]
MKTIKFKYMKLVLCTGLVFMQALPGKSCDLSGFTLNNVSSLGNNKYKLDVTFCAGNGRNNNRYGADQGTTYFSFYLSNNSQLDTWSHDTLRSPVTGDVFRGYRMVDNSYLSVPYNAQALFYIPDDDYGVWTCIQSTCGGVSSVCRSISIYTIGLPDTVWCRGMEAAGNTLGGCTNLRVFPRCFGISPAVSTGGNQTVYLSGTPNCATLNGAATGGNGSYSYKWNTGATTSSITVCPTVNTVYTLTVTDANGCAGTSSATVVTSCARSSLTANAGSDKLITIGYGSNCATLAGSASGGYGTYAYKWSHGPTTASTSVCPGNTTNYNLIVTDGYGCKDTDMVQVAVKDVRCGKNLANINVCYQGRTKCVSSSNLTYYTSRGATIGACGSLPFMPAVNAVAEDKLEIYPNPAEGVVYAVLTIKESSRVQLTDMSGRQLKQFDVQPAADGTEQMVQIDLQGIAPGLYLVQVLQQNGTQRPLVQRLWVK